MTHKPSKAAASKTFSTVCLLQMQLASMDVFCSMWKLKDVIFPKSLSLLRDFFNRHIVVFFATSVLKEVRILRYLDNNSAMLILMLMLSSKIKLSYTILIQIWNTFVAEFFMIMFCTLFILWLFHTFPYKWGVFFKKLKASLKACFYIIL